MTTKTQSRANHDQQTGAVLLAVIAAELRTLRRLARTGVLVAIGIGAMLAAYGYYSYLHGEASQWSLNAGTSLPRLSAAYFNSYVLWFFMAALVFLAFDVRGRDERERMQDVLDSRPISNTTLLWGRLVAIVLAVWLPAAGALGLIQVAGLVGRAAGFWMFAVEPVSTVTFALLDALPALVLWGAIVFALSLGLRNRLAAAVAALALLGLHMASFALTPAYLLPAISLLHIHDNWASDLAPRFADAATYAHRASMLLLAVAFIVWAAAAHRRADDRRLVTRMLTGALLAVLGATGIGGVALRCMEDMRQRDAWLAAHEEVREVPLPKARAIRGHVRIAPGESLAIDLDMELAAPADGALDQLIFSLNPGLRVGEVRIDGIAATFRHQQGLLAVDLPRPLATGDSTTLALRASGAPDMRFAYLDSAVHWQRASARNALLWLGTEAGIFESRYVALMPSLRWLPVPGANLDTLRTDFPRVELAVEVPAGWHVAGATRDRKGNSDARMEGVIPLPALGLLASRFARRSLEIGDVTMELLLHRAHQRNADYFADAETVALLRTRLEETLDETAALGIPYPYKTFSVVEVPAQLRMYGGGWRLDAGAALAGVLPIKEHGFAYGNFARYLARFPAAAERMAETKVQLLANLFNYSYVHANARHAFARNLLTFQTAASGRGAVALGYVGESLTATLLSDPEQRFFMPIGTATAHSMNADAGFGATVAGMAWGIANMLRENRWSGFWQPGNPQASAWARASAVPLGDLDFHDDAPRALAALSLRGDAVAKSVIDAAGRERVAALLAALRREHGGGSYDARDFAKAGGEELRNLLGDWLDEAALPAFAASRPRVLRVARSDAPEGFETRVHVRNTAPVPGLVRLGQSIYETGQHGEPVVIPAESAMELALVTEAVPPQLWVIPYLARNRFSMLVEMPSRVENPDVADPAEVGVALPSDWLPPPVEGIVIDDLDPGFSVESRGDGDLRLAAWARGASTIDYDQGLPTFSRQPGEWSRASIPTAWGRYRRSVAGTISGDGATVAVFTAELPTPGRWRLGYHIPERTLPPPPGYGNEPTDFYGELGLFDLAVVAGERAEPVAFDGADAAIGWNRLGEFDLASTQVRVEVSTRTNGDMVLADAVRWLPAQ